MKNYLYKLCALLLAASTLLISGCAGYEKMSENVNGKMADFYTKVRDGEKKVIVEDTPNAKKLTLNLKYRLATGKYMDNDPPKLTGDMIYQSSCKRFGFQVVLKNADDVQIDVKNIGFGEYEGGSKRLFDVDAYKESGREDSNKVKTLVVKNITCS